MVRENIVKIRWPPFLSIPIQYSHYVSQDENGRERGSRCFSVRCFSIWENLKSGPENGPGKDRKEDTEQFKMELDVQGKSQEGSKTSVAYPDQIER
jgi:hypothetical protein